MPCRAVQKNKPCQKKPCRAVPKRNRAKRSLAVPCRAVLALSGEPSSEALPQEEVMGDDAPG